MAHVCSQAGHRELRTVLALLVLGCCICSATAYANVTLSSLDGDLSVVVYLPQGLKPEERTFYYASRFDHGSMIGDIKRKVRTTNSHGETNVHRHVLFESDMWRVPHNSNWPESGVGLAAEFGVGDDGAFCYYRCGWNQASDVTNGVLGYSEAKNGESFLKIGVGELIKGSCPTCDSTDDYKFNSPYLFAREPDWKIAQMSEHAIVLEHQAHLNTHGYRLTKDISLVDNVLSVTSTLTNLGLEPFSTAWYAHNFFTCDGNAVGPGYSADLDLRGDRSPLYDEPGTWSWSTPLTDYGDVQGNLNSVNINMQQALHPGVRIKTEFIRDSHSHGGYRIQACDTVIDSYIPEVEIPGTGLSMYAYNLYVERATLSPEPQILMTLNPGESKAWTQRLVISDATPSAPPASLWLTLRSMTIDDEGREAVLPYSSLLIVFAIVAAAATFFSQLVMMSVQRYRRTRHYQVIPENLPPIRRPSQLD